MLHVLLHIYLSAWEGAAYLATLKANVAVTLRYCLIRNGLQRHIDFFLSLKNCCTFIAASIRHTYATHTS